MVRTIRRAVTRGALDEVSSGTVLDAFAQAATHPAVLARGERPFPIEPVGTLAAIHFASALVLRQALPDLRLLSADDRVCGTRPQLCFEMIPGVG